MPERSRTRGDGAARRGKKARTPRADVRAADEAGAGAEESPEAARSRRPRPFWSGTLAFGLVSIPVGLYPGLRQPLVSLRMLDPDGEPVGRRYFGADDEGPLEPDEIVRGYQVEDDRFVVVEDEELEALAPEKSQEMELSRFVDVDEIEPALFDRGYVLAPDRGALRAYRLLADAMEQTGRAGIATAVMRGKEYLVAIVADHGILRAETLRFADEVRTPEDVGLPDLEAPEAGELERMQRAMAGLERDSVDRELLVDRGAERLMRVVRRKLASGEDVVRTAAPDDAGEDEDDGGGDTIDLMEVLKRSLEDDGEA